MYNANMACNPGSEVRPRGRFQTRRDEQELPERLMLRANGIVNWPNVDGTQRPKMRLWNIASKWRRHRDHVFAYEIYKGLIVKSDKYWLRESNCWQSSFLILYWSWLINGNTMNIWWLWKCWDLGLESCFFLRCQEIGVNDAGRETLLKAQRNETCVLHGMYNCNS